jgi:hypothetical protein
MRLREIAERVGKGLIRTQRLHCKGKVVRMASNIRVGEMQLRSKKAFYRVSYESYAFLSTKYERALNIPTQTIRFPNLGQNIG